MIVLGRTHDDKGTQLERLTRTLLSDRGYQDLTMNLVGTGGEELDVDGRLHIPSLGTVRTHRIICECKAYSRPVDLPAWLKFCGKLFTAERTRRETVHGCFIALSGVNGNVKGHYDELKSHCDEIDLIQGDTLEALVATRFNLVPLEQVRQSIAQRFNRVSRNEIFAYYDNMVYWVVLFQVDSYTVLSNRGEPLSLAANDNLREMISESLAVAQYVDLREEENARRRGVLLDTIILEHLMMSDGCGSVAEAPNRDPDVFDENERRDSGRRLLEAGLVAGEIDGDLRLISPATEGARISSVFLRLFGGPFATLVLQSRWYTEGVNEQLWNEITEIQFGLELPDADRVIALRILRYSPSALCFALHPNPMLRHGEDQQRLRNELTNQMDRDFFMQSLFDHLLHDFHGNRLNGHFRDYLHLHELDISRTYNVKFVPEEVISEAFRERVRICPVSEAHGGGLILIRLRNDATEPWEPMRNPDEPVEQTTKTPPAPPPEVADAPQS